MALRDPILVAFGVVIIGGLLAILCALLQRVPDAISAQLAALPATLAAMLQVEIAEYFDLYTRALDFVIYHWHRNGLRIGLACGCWVLLTLHRRPRFWALLPFRCIWHFLLFFNLSLWVSSVRCPVEKELRHLLPNFSLLPRWIEIPDDSLAHVDKGPPEEPEETNSPKKVYKGPIVRSLRSRNSVVNSAPIMRSRS